MFALEMPSMTTPRWARGELLEVAADHEVFKGDLRAQLTRTPASTTLVTRM